ncbi:MAG TPA: cell wall hydrolase [Sphingomicrobium sp.]|nr:cell wall hydrolase [Sphingomicrobium sp.]
MKRFWGAGGASAIIAAIALAFGGSGQALAQQVSNFPVVQAVVKTTVGLPAASAAPGSVEAVAKEATILQRAGWPLYALVDKFSGGSPMTDQAQCIAVAVYHEARGETLEGQLAVAKVIMNRAASGKYPASWCGVVKQPWQFSFVNPRTGHVPSVDEASAAWGKALGITRLAVANAIPILSDDVLWYHADYVAPGWGRRLTKVNKIGAHIFYRA